MEMELDLPEATVTEEPESKEQQQLELKIVLDRNLDLHSQPSQHTDTIVTSRTKDKSMEDDNESLLSIEESGLVAAVIARSEFDGDDKMDTDERVIQKNDEERAHVKNSSDDEDEDNIAGIIKRKIANRLFSDESGEEEREKQASVHSRIKLSGSEGDYEKKKADKSRSESEEELLDIENSFAPSIILSSDKSKGKGTKKEVVKKEKKKRLPTRKERDETMKKIKSQTQKLQRERRLEIPYHKPRQLTLDAFLQRHKTPVVSSEPEILATSVSTKKEANVVDNSLGNKHKAKPNLRKLNYTVDLSIENELLAIRPESKKSHEDFSLPSDLEEENEEKEEQNRQEKIKKINDMIGSSPSKPEATVQNWLENIEDVEEILLDNSDKLDSIVNESDEEAAPKTVQKWLENETNNIMEEIRQEETKLISQSNAETESSSKVNAADSSENECELVIDERPVRPDLKERNGNDELLSNKSINGDAEPIAREHEKKTEIQPEPGKANKKRSIRELLMSLPNYQKIAELKPSFKKDDNENFIDLSIDDDSPVSKSKNKTKSRVKNLMDRFIKHTVIPKKPADEHFNVHISRKVEDSQGVEQDVVESVEYVAHNIENEDDGKSTVGIRNSPATKTPPGPKLVSLREKLKAQIKEKKFKEYEKRLQEHAMYNEEKLLEDKDNNVEEEEELEDEFSSSNSGESEPDETDEEALQEYWKEKDRKKKHRKLEFADNEAEEEDADPELIDLEESSDELEDDDVQDEESNQDAISNSKCDEDKSENDDDEEKIKVPAKRSHVLDFKESDDEEDIILIENPAEVNTKTNSSVCADFDHKSAGSTGGDVQLVANATAQDKSLATEEKTPSLVENSSEEWSERNELGMDTSQSLAEFTKSTLATDSIFQLKDKTPEIPLKTVRYTYGRKSELARVNYFSTFQGIISPLQVQPDSNLLSLDSFKSNTNTPSQNNFDSEMPAALDNESEHNEVPTDIANLISGKSKFVSPLPLPLESPKFTQNDAMLGLCSGKFPTQQPISPQEETQYPGFATECNEESENSEPVKTPKTPVTPAQGLINNVPHCNTDTPKVSDKIKRTRVLFRGNEKSTNDPKSKIVDRIDYMDDEDDDVNNVGQKQSESEPEGKKQYKRIYLSENSDEEDDIVAANDDPSENESDNDSAESNSENEEEGEEIIQKRFKAFKTKSGKIRKDFVEDEAELSGSERNSSDEDERELDLDDEELVFDEDVGDEDALRAQVERVHLKQSMNDDEKRIRELQEMFLDNGDLHGDGNVRQRQFKWKDLDMTDEDARMEGVEMDAENEVELRWQQERLDKIKWMTENSQKLENDDEDKTLLDMVKEDSKSLNLSKGSLQRVERFVSFSQANNFLQEGLSARSSSKWLKTKKSEDDDFGSSYSFLNFNTSIMNHSSSNPDGTPTSPINYPCGSFLKLGPEELSRYASIADKACEEKVGGANKNSKRFIFTTIDKPPEQNESHKNKRKAACPSKFQPRKAVKIDRSTSGPSSNPKISKSVFNWMK